MKARKIRDLPPFQQPPAPLRRAKNAHENPLGFPRATRLRWVFSFHFLGDFQIVFQCDGVPPQADAWGSSPRVGGSHYVRTLGYRERVAPYQSERSERAADAMCVPTAPRVAGTPPQVQELGPLPPRLGADGRMVGWSAYAAGWRRAGPSRRNLAGFDGWSRGLWGFLVELLQWWCNHGTHPCRPPPSRKNQHLAGKTSPAPWLFRSRDSRVSAQLRPCCLRRCGAAQGIPAKCASGPFV